MILFIDNYKNKIEDKIIQYRWMLQKKRNFNPIILREEDQSIDILNVLMKEFK